LKGYKEFMESGVKSIGGSRFVADMNWFETSGYVGLLVAFIISLSISVKSKWFWLNSLIVFLLSYVLTRFDLNGWHYLKFLFLAPGQYFDSYSTWNSLANGLPMLTIGVLLFFLKLTNRFIINGTLINSKSLHTT
jgi:hypothetical protein